MPLTPLASAAQSATATTSCDDTAAEAFAPQRVNGGYALMDALHRHGVDHIFGYPGGAILPIYDARGLVRRIDGLGSIDDVTKEIEAIIGQK